MSLINTINHKKLPQHLLDYVALLWEFISTLGIKVEEDESVSKRIMLANRLSVLMFIFITTSLLIFSRNHRDSELLIVIASINFIPLLTLLLNVLSKTNYSRLFLGVMTPIMVLFSIVSLKVLSASTSFEISEYHFYTPRYYLVAMCLLPLFLIDIKEKRIFISALIINTISLILFDFAHDVCGVGHEQFGFQFVDYYQATIMPVLLLFFLYGSIIFYQAEAKKYEEKINFLLEIEKLRNSQSAAEMQLAKTVIDGLLPKTIPEIKDLETSAALRWCKEVGGDYYTIKKIDSDNFLIVIVDVAGKGLAASIIVSTIHSCIETQMGNGTFQLNTFIEKLNEVTCKITEGSSYATCFAAVYNQATSQLESINAGHPAPFLFSKNEIIELSIGGTILGIIDDGYIAITEKHILKPKDILVLYTDGLTEAANEKDRLYGDDTRMTRCIQSNRLKPAQSIIRILMDDIKDFSKKETFDDDFTCMVFKKE